MYRSPANLNTLFLNVTDACNLECRYCFVQQKPHYMSLRVAKDAVEFLMSSASPREEKGIVFFGGEPTLCWDNIIVPLVDYIHQKNYNIRFDMTTNAILLDAEKFKYLKDNNFHILFSCDGDKETQDFNRPCHCSDKSSFDILEPKMDTIAREFNTTFRSTLYPPTCHNLFHNIMFAQSKGFHYYFGVPDEFSEWRSDDIVALDQNLGTYTMYYLDSYKESMLPDDFIEFTPLSKALQDLGRIKQMASQGITIQKTLQNLPCGIGAGALAVNYEGALFLCQQMPSRGYDENPHFVGDIYNGVIGEKHKQVIEEYISHDNICSNPELCYSCPRKIICNGKICNSDSYLIYGNPYTISESRCLWEQLLLKYANLIDLILREKQDSVYYREAIRHD